MAKTFNLTAELNLRGPTNLKSVVSNIRRQLGTIDGDLKLKIDPSVSKNISAVSSKLQAMNNILVSAKQNALDLDSTFKSLSNSLNTIQRSSTNSAAGIQKNVNSLHSTAKAAKQATSRMEEFGKQSALAIKRFAAFSVVTSGVYALINAITSGTKAFIDFDKQLIKLEQVTGRSRSAIAEIENEITRLSTSLGVSSSDLIEVASTLAQAGISAKDTKIALEALAKTELAPSFDNLNDTVEGSIALMRQFGIATIDLEKALGSINAVAAAFAVESSDIISAIQRTGGVFAAASKGVSEGTDALNEFIAVFTSVRATTRESAETIATGLRTIFTRIQRAGTIEQLKQFGIELTDLEGKFVGPFEAVKRLSEGLSQLDPRDIRFAGIVEELGGFRQIGKVIPLIQQFATAQEALKVAQRGQDSLTGAQIKAQESLANQLAKVREQFLALVRDIGKSSAFQNLFKIVTSLASGLISLVGAFKPILPLLSLLAVIKGAGAITKFATGFIGGFGRGGGASNIGNNLGETVSGVKEKQRAETTARATDAIRNNTDAIKNLTSAVQSLDSTIRSKGTTGLNDGGLVRKFARGGVVPGSGNRDTVPAMLTPGEFVIRKKAVETIGAGNLQRMNKYANGGQVKKFGYGGEVWNDPVGSDFKIDKKSGARISDGDTIAAKVFTVKEYRLDAVDAAEPNQKYGKEATNILNQYRNNILDTITSGTGGAYGRGKFTLNSAAGDIVRLGYGIPDVRYGGERFGSELKEAKSTGRGIWNSSNYNHPKRILFEAGNKQDKAKEIAENRKLDYSQRRFAFGGLVQKFAGGSPGGVRVPKGRGKAGARGARDVAEPISTETYLRWAKGIYDEYDADPSLTMAIGAGGVRMPPEIALANKLLTQMALETGGAGLKVGTRFVRTPKNQIVDELRPFLVPDPSDPNELGFYADEIARFGRPKTKKQKRDNQIGPLDRSSALAMEVAKQADEVAAREQRWTSIRDGSPIDKYLLSALTDPMLSDYRTVRSGGTLSNAKGEEIIFHYTRLRRAVNKALEEYDDFYYSTGNIDKLVSGMAAERFAAGGFVQKFLEGGETETPVPKKISKDILDRIKALGGKGGIIELSSEAVATLVKTTGVSANQLLKTPVLGAMPNGAEYAPALETLLKVVEAVKKQKDNAARKQLENNMKAAGGGAYQFGLVSIFGPNGKLGYEGTSAAKELTGKNGEKFLTQIVRRSLPSRYADAIQSIQTDISGTASRGAEQIQYTDIFGNAGLLAFDFDETLVKNADIFAPNGGIDIKAYNDLAKVQEALANAELTLLGKELSRRLQETPQLLDMIRVLTARPQSNAPYLASALNRLGLPISENKITGVSGGLNKVDNLSQMETLIDDNLSTITAIQSAGKKGYLYSEPKGIDKNNPSSKKSMDVMEGYVLEEMVKSLGVNIANDDTDPNRPIDYPNGLGNSAGIWGIQSTLPTDTKRTNDSSALTRIWAEAQRYFVEKFAFGGKVEGKNFEEVRKQIIDKYPDIDFRISKRKKGRGFGYNLIGALKSAGGLLGDSSLNFEQPTNLQQLIDFSDKMAQKLMSPKEFAKGGSSQDTVPALLTPGEFVINKKAAQKIGYSKLAKLNKADKIQGYNKGGIVDGVQRFFRGGVAEKDAVRAQGALINDVKEAEKTFAMIMGQLGKTIRVSIIDNFKGIEAIGAGGKTSLGTRFSEQTRGQAAFRGDTTVMGLQIKGRKAAATTETVAHEAGHLADYSLGGKKGFASKTEGTFQFELVEKVKKQMEAAFKASGESADKIKNYLTKNEELFAEFFAKASPDVRAIITSTTDAKIGAEKLAQHLGDTGYTFAGLEASDIADLFGGTRGGGGGTPPSGGGGGGTPPSGGGGPSGPNNKAKADAVAAEQAEFFAYKAREAGMEVEKYQRMLAKQAANLAKDLQVNMKNKLLDLKFTSINLGANLKGRNRGGSDEDKNFIRKAEETLLEKLQAIKPNLPLKDLETQAARLVDELIAANGSFEGAIEKVKGLENVMDTSYDTTEALRIAMERLSEQTGITTTILAGQGIGVNAERRMDPLRNAMATLGDIIEAAGGRIRVVGIGLTIVGDRLRALMNSLDSNTRTNVILMSTLGGFIGAAQGMVAGQAIGRTGGDLLERLFPNIAGLSGRFELAATAVGTFIGAVNGAYDALYRADLDRVLNNISTSGAAVDSAFENLSKNNTPEAFIAAQQALRSSADSIIELVDQANFGAGGASRTAIEWMRGLDPTGMSSAISGAPTEREAREQLMSIIGDQVNRARQLGDIRMTRVRSEDIAQNVNRTQEFDKQITAARTAGNTAEIQRLQTERTNFLSTSSQVFGQLRQIYQTDSDAFLALFMEQQQRSGRTAEQIADMVKTPEGMAQAIQEGQRLSAMYAEQEQRSRLLADATRNMVIQTENLLDIYRIFESGLTRFGESINNIRETAVDAAAALNGQAAIRPNRRRDQQALENMGAYSFEEIRDVAGRVGSLAGGGDTGKRLENQIVAAKFIQEKLPNILRNTTADNAEGAVDELSAQLGKLGITLDPAVAKELSNTLASKLTGKGKGTTLAEIADDPTIVESFTKLADGARKAAIELEKVFYDALDKSIASMNDYSKAIEESTDLQLKAAEIRAGADIQLAETLGQSIGYNQRNAGFENRIRSLSSSSVIPGGTIDPRQLYNALNQLTQERAAANAELENRARAVQAATTDAEKAAADQAYKEQIDLMAQQNVQINNTRKALEELANDSRSAANILQELEQYRSTTKAGVNLAQDILTAEPDKLRDINKQLIAYNKVISGQATPTEIGNVKFRQQAFGGLDMLRNVLPEKIAQQMQARMSREMLTSMGVDLGQTIAIGPNEEKITLDQALTNVETGKDPQQEAYIEAYRQATERQAQAADMLGLAAVEAAMSFRDSALAIIDAFSKSPEEGVPALRDQAAVATETATPEPIPEQQDNNEPQQDLALIAKAFDGAQASLIEMMAQQSQESTWQVASSTIAAAVAAAIGGVTMSWGQQLLTSIGETITENLTNRLVDAVASRISDSGAGGASSLISALAKLTAVLEIGRGLYFGATADTSTNNEIKALMGELPGTIFNAITAAMTGNTGQSFTGTVLGIEEEKGNVMAALDNMFGSLEAAGRGAAIGYQFGGARGAMIGAIVALVGDVAKNIGLLVGEVIGLRKDQADARNSEEKTRRMEEDITEERIRARGTKGELLRGLPQTEQNRVFEAASTQVVINRAEKFKQEGKSLEDLAKVEPSVTSSGAKTLDEYIAIQQNKLNRLQTERADARRREGIASNDTPAFNEALKAEIEFRESQLLKPLESVETMANNATKPGSIYTHDKHLEKLLLQLLGQDTNQTINKAIEFKKINSKSLSDIMKAFNPADMFNNILDSFSTSTDYDNINNNKTCCDKSLDILQKILLELKGKNTEPAEKIFAKIKETNLKLSETPQFLLDKFKSQTQTTPTAATTTPAAKASTTAQTQKEYYDKRKASAAANIAANAPGVAAQQGTTAATQTQTTAAIPVVQKPKTVLEQRQQQKRLSELKRKGPYATNDGTDRAGRSYVEQKEYMTLQNQIKTPYQKMLDQRRQAYLSRFRPEVRQRMLTSDEKAAQKYNQTQTNLASAPITRAQKAEQQQFIQTAAPVPVSKPITVAAQQTPTQTTPNGQQAYTVQMDPKAQEFLTSLDKTMGSFNNYITRLENVAEKIPKKIDLVLVTEPVEVNVKLTGAAVIEELKKSPEAIKNMIDTQIMKDINKKITNISQWIKQTSGTDLNPGK